MFEHCIWYLNVAALWNEQPAMNDFLTPIKYKLRHKTLRT